MEGDELQRLAHERALELPGSHLDHPFGPDWDVFKVRGRVFMLQTRRADTPIVTLKADPTASELLRETYSQIRPGYHMNKRHWITLNPGDEIDEQLVRDLVTESYLLVVDKLPRAQRPVNPDTFGQSVNPDTFGRSEEDSPSGL